MASWTVGFQAPLSMESSRQEYLSRVPFPTPGDLPDPGIKSASLESPASAGSSLLAPPGKPSEAWEGVIDRICAHGIDWQNWAGVESSVYHGVIKSIIQLQDS